MTTETFRLDVETVCENDFTAALLLPQEDEDPVDPTNSDLRTLNEEVPWAAEGADPLQSKKRTLESTLLGDGYLDFYSLMSVDQEELQNCLTKDGQ